MSLLLLLLSFYNQGQPIVIGHEYQIQSKAFNDTRKIYISTPANYQHSGKTYPVMFVLDGERHFLPATGLVASMVESNSIPEMFVVAISSKNRFFEMGPAFTSGKRPGTGGADQFIAYIKDDLMPYIAKNYPVNDYRILVGHSLGGLFSIYTLQKHPELFQAIIAISPSLVWDQNAVVKASQTFLKQNPKLKASLYLTLGNEGTDMLGAIMRYTGNLAEFAPSQLRWKFDHLPQESHISVPLISMRQGLNFIFEDWFIKDAIGRYDLGGEAAIVRHYQKLSERLGMERKIPEGQWDLLGFSLMMAKRHQESLQIYKRYAKEFPNSFTAHNYLAQAYQNLGQTEAAIEHFKKALHLFPYSSAVRENLKALKVDVSNIPTKIEIPTARRAHYEGTYQLDQMWLMDIKNDGEHLIATIHGKEPAQFSPIGQDQFYSEDFDASLKFEFKDGKVEKLKVYMFGKDQYYMPVKEK